MPRLLALVAGVAVVLSLPLTASPSPDAAACGGSTPGGHVLGHVAGDIDGDGRAERVSLVRYRARPLECRFLLVARGGSRVRSAVVPTGSAAWTEPQLIGLAGIARGSGLQAIVDSRCCGAYLTGQWLFRATHNQLKLLRVIKATTLVPNTFGNGASLCCGESPSCGSRRGVVLVFGEGRGAKPVDLAEVWVQQGEAFSFSRRERLRRPRKDDFRNCKPFIAAS